MSTAHPASASLETLLARLNPQQREGVMAPLSASLSVQAGAGTGKTEFITRRFVKLSQDLKALGYVNPTERLWVSTFTDKAAKEMAGRIRKLLEETGEIPLADSAWIGTFHGLCQRMLSASMPDNGQNTPFSLADDIECELMREDMVRSLLDGSYTDIGPALARFQLDLPPNMLSPESLLTLELDDYEGLFVSILGEVIPRLKAAGLSPDVFYTLATRQIGAFTQLMATLPNGSGLGIPHYTEHADFAHAWARHLTPLRHDAFTFTPSDWVVSRDIAKANAKGSKTVPSEQSLLKKSLKPFYDFGCYVTYDGRKRKAPFFPPSEDFSLLHRATAHEYALLQVAVALYAVYQHGLEQTHRMDFDDLIHRTVLRLETQPEVKAQFADQFAHFMVDEFQDSNGLQLRLVQHLAGTQAPPLTVVGDKKQSIYGFRYAEPENLSVLFKDVPTAQTVSLQTNYRSSSVILAFANRVTQMMGLETSEELLPADSNAAEPIHWLTLPDGLTKRQASVQELEWIVAEMEHLLASQTYTPKDMAVLVESHKKAQAVEAALKAAGIPAIRQRLLGFFDAPEIQKAMALLALMRSPEDDVACIGLLQQVLSHRGLAQLAQLRKETDQTSFFGAIQVAVSQKALWPDEMASQQALLYALANKLPILAAQAPEMKLTDALTRLFESFGVFFPDWQASGPDGDLALLHRVMTHWEEATKKPLLFEYALTRLERYQAKNRLDVPVAEEDIDVTGDAVRILTLHAAKGLEFPVVFLAAVESARSKPATTLLTVDPQYPGKIGVGLLLNKFEGDTTLKKTAYDLTWRKPREQEEDLRRLYVAVTRPRERLYLSTWPKSLAWLQPDLFTDVPITLSP